MNRKYDTDSIITLEQLLELVPDTSRKRSPTCKELKESQPTVLLEFSKGLMKIVVYANGYFVYSYGRRTTVQSVYRCRNAVRYEYGDGVEKLVGMETFGKLPYTIRLTIEGEQRLEANQNNRETSHSYVRGHANYPENMSQQSEFAEKYTANTCIDTLLQMEQTKMLNAALSKLTALQEHVVRRYFFDGMNQQEIATELGVTRQTVHESLHMSLKRLLKLLR